MRYDCQTLSGLIDADASCLFRYAADATSRHTRSLFAFAEAPFAAAAIASTSTRLFTCFRRAPAKRRFTSASARPTRRYRRGVTSLFAARRMFTRSSFLRILSRIVYAPHAFLMRFKYRRRRNTVDDDASFTAAFLRGKRYYADAPGLAIAGIAEALTRHCFDAPPKRPRCRSAGFISRAPAVSTDAMRCLFSRFIMMRIIDAAMRWLMLAFCC